MTYSTSRQVRAAVLAGAALTLGLMVQPAAGQEIALYENDFESPNRPITVNCGNSLDQTGINASYGRPGYSFVEDFTVETVVLRDPAGKYGDPGRSNGRYAIGMTGVAQNDRLALRLNVQSQQFLNVTMDVSSIDVEGCSGPFGVQTPRFKLTLLDSPRGVFDWNAKKLDEKTLHGEPAPSAWSFAWSRGTVALDASRATDGNVIVVFDLDSQGYAVFDNLEITATKVAAVADRDADGVDDATDNCPSHANGNQANLDQDSAGDACDPAPMDPERCGDRGGDGVDDCRDFCRAHAVPRCSAGGAGSIAGGRGASRPGAPAAGRGGAGVEDDVDAGVGEDEDEDAPPRRWGGGGPSEPDEPEGGGGCGIAPIDGERPPPVAISACVTLVLCLQRLRRRRCTRELARKG